MYQLLLSLQGCAESLMSTQLLKWRVYIWNSPKKEERYLIAVLNGAFGKKACFHFSHFLSEDIK